MQSMENNFNKNELPEGVRIGLNGQTEFTFKNSQVSNFVNKPKEEILDLDSIEDVSEDDFDLDKDQLEELKENDFDAFIELMNEKAQRDINKEIKDSKPVEYVITKEDPEPTEEFEWQKRKDFQ